MTRPGLKRSLMYVFSLAILALGITLNTKTQLGVSPIVSVPYCISQLASLPLGLTTFVHYLLLILLQKILLGKDFPPLQYLQILCSLVTSLFIQGWDMLLPLFDPLWLRILVLFIAIFITGLGASLSLAMDIVPNPADGLADAVGRKIRRDVGMGKNLIDLVSVTISLALGLLFAHRVLGIGLGTVAAVLLTGRVYALVHHRSLNLASRLKQSERA
ncbi:MAG: hypothetical protein IKX47_06970 [Oscillospiraceae bacterium]|nr:hypothetical protein [Oscillospiraceae bacterium]